MKRSQKLLLLLGVLLVAVAVCIIVIRFIEADKVTETQGTYPVSDIAFDDIAGLSWTVDGEAIDIRREGDGWINPADADFPVDTNKADALARAISDMQASVKVEGVTESSEYGLGEGAFRVDVALTDGSTVTFLGGDENKIIKAFYVKTADSADVFAIGNSLSKTFRGLYSLMRWDELPAADDRYFVSIQDASGALFSATRYMDPKGDGFYFTNGYKWFLTDSLSGEPEPLVYTEMATLCRTLANLKFSDCVTYRSDGSLLSEYGFDAAIEIHMKSVTDVTAADGTVSTEEQPEYVLQIGSKFTVTDDDGTSADYYYAMVPGSNAVYSVKADKVQDIVEFDPAKYLPTQLLKFDFEELSTLTLDYGEETNSFASAVTTTTRDIDVTQADGTVTTETDTFSESSCTLNGDVEIDADAYETIVDSLIDIEIKERLPEDDAEHMDLVYSVSLVYNTDDGKPHPIRFYEYSADLYLVDYFGGRTVLVSASDADDVLRQLRSLTK